MAAAQVKHEPLELETDCSGVGTGYAMENSTSHCVMATGNGSDPLLQETINALMNGAGGIEVVAGTAAASDEVDRSHECQVCGKLFTRSNTLSYHLKVHNDERPFKCGNCDKAFREQYRLMKHQRTHVAKEQPSGVDQETEHSQDSSFPSTSAGQTTAEDEDYATGDSERFFKSYELQEGTAALKLEPDISLTVDGTNPQAAIASTTAQSSASEHDVRYQIIEERIKSLQREVHLVNSNLNRVETKLDGLTKIIAIFINKFDEVDTQNAGTAEAASSNLQIPLVSIPVEALPVATQQPPPPPPPTPAATAIQMITTHQPVVPMVTAASIPVQIQQQPVTFPPAVPTVCHSNNGNSSVKSSNHNNDTFPEVPELPIRTVNDFLDLNDHCSDNEQFLLQMMIRLHQEVDNSQPHQRNVKKMMEALVTYEVLCQFSWSGKSAINGQYTKYVFGNSVGIIDLLIKTLNLGKTNEEAQSNQKPILTAIQSFIKHSRQNMLRDSRKRRESGGGVYPPAIPADTRPVKQRVPEQDMVNQF